MGNHHVAEDTVKILSQNAIDGFFSIGAKKLDLLGFGKSVPREAVNCGFDGICHKELLVCKKMRKAIDKRGKVEYTINVGATCDGCFPKLKR